MLIRHATTEGVIALAAASDGRSTQIGFPARMPEVIPVHSADATGMASDFNCRPQGDHQDFSFLGEDVQSAWPVAFDQDFKKRLTGISVATSVAVGIAALILTFAKQEAQQLEPACRRYLRSPEGMRKVFRFLSSSRTDYGYVTPWKLLSKRQGRARATRLLQNLLEAGEDH